MSDSQATKLLKQIWTAVLTSLAGMLVIALFSLVGFYYITKTRLEYNDKEHTSFINQINVNSDEIKDHDKRINKLEANKP